MSALVTWDANLNGKVVSYFTCVCVCLSKRERDGKQNKVF